MSQETNNANDTFLKLVVLEGYISSVYDDRFIDLCLV